MAIIGKSFRRGGGVAVLAASLALTALPLGGAPAHGFGSSLLLGQQAEHERITRAALACPQFGPDYCLETRTLDFLAGNKKLNYTDLGAVGIPDKLPGEGDEAHCDNADYWEGNGTYPVSRHEASVRLLTCVDYTRTRFAAAVDKAVQLFEPQTVVFKPQPQFGEAKQEVQREFGRMLHTVQDFYAHSNWSDFPDPARPVGLDNAPGLGQSMPTLLFDNLVPAPTLLAVPRPLSTGCYPNSKCGGHIWHGAPLNDDDPGLNKDKGYIDPVDGHTSGPKTVRGKVAGNFDRAVRNAITDTRLQWVDLRQAILARYGNNAGGALMCALTRDDPHRDCVGGRAAASDAPRTADSADSAGASGAPRAECGAGWEQPGGAGTAVFMHYTNCGEQRLTVAPFAEDAQEGGPTYTYARLCRPVEPGQYTTWVIEPRYLPPGDTRLQTAARCFNGPEATRDGTADHAPPIATARDAADPVPCGDTWEQAAAGEPVRLTHRNCTDGGVTRAPLATGDSGTRYAYSQSCFFLEPGATYTWTIDSAAFPPTENTSLQRTTRCL